jgi:hypothetical protein
MGQRSNIRTHGNEFAHERGEQWGVDVKAIHHGNGVAITDPLNAPGHRCHLEQPV